MDTFVTVIHVVLIFFAGAAGLLRLLTPYTRFVQLPFQDWGNDFKPWHIKLIGLLEVFAALGLIASLFLPSLAPLAPFAAVGVALVMAGAMATHLRRSEYLNVGGNMVWLGLALFLAYGKVVGFAV